MQDFELLGKEDVYAGKKLKVSVEAIRLPSGRETKREVIRHPGAAAIVPLIAPGVVVLIKQFRYCVGKVLWEIPAGTLEEGETPMECAERELIEESGYRAGKLEPMGGFFPAPGFCTEYLSVFLATELEPCASAPDADEVISAHKVSLDEALRMIDDGEIVDAKTIVGLLKLLRRGPPVHEV